MEKLRIEEIAGRIVEMVFGRGYVSPAAAWVFNVSVEILSNVPDDKVAGVSTKIVAMCRAVASEADMVGASA